MKKVARPSRFRARPLLVASAGIAVISIGACGSAGKYPVGNLLAPPCDGGFDSVYCRDVTDGGPTDGGTDGGQ